MLLKVKSFTHQISPFYSAVYTFENADHLMAFSASSSSTLERSSTHYKDGTHSMKWTWTSGKEFIHKSLKAASKKGLKRSNYLQQSLI